MFPEVVTQEDFVSYLTEDQKEKVASAVRGVTLKRVGVEVSQIETKFHVTK